MKAILIDTPQHQIRGIEIGALEIKQALSGTRYSQWSVAPVELASVHISESATLFFDRNGVLSYPADYFYIEGVDKPVYGKGLLLGRARGICSTLLTVNGVEAIVALHKLPRTKIKT